MQKDLTVSTEQPRYLNILGMTVAALWIICLLSQSRLVALPTGYIAAAVLPYPFFCCILDIIAEVYGYLNARRTLAQALIILYSFALIIFIFDKLPAPTFWAAYTKAFNTTVSPIAREVVIGSIAVLIGQYLNIYFFSKLFLLTKGKFFAIRSISSTILGDSTTFAIALYGDFIGHMPTHKIFTLVMDELIIMYIMAIILAIPSSLIVAKLKRIEPKYDMSIKFNPFK